MQMKLIYFRLDILLFVMMFHVIVFLNYFGELKLKVILKKIEDFYVNNYIRFCWCF
jgi:hypothetical protein